ncbi:MAG: hypothetical protein COB04_00180 [Gammaproteobacteria bacterium]|nr:MAG: hypothetical protein COB04_00180 [Gammaproteobacteria bacterium]
MIARHNFTTLISNPSGTNAGASISAQNPKSSDDTLQRSQDAANSNAVNDSFNGATVIDQEGKETPITEIMIQDALDQLESYTPYQSIPH